MKFTIAQKELKDVVSWAAGSLQNRTATPILSGIFLEAEETTLKISSFNSEVSARLEIPVEAEKTGSVLVLGKLLEQIVASFPDDTVKIENAGNKVSLKCKNSNFNLATMPIAEYPSLPSLPESSGVVDSAQFKEAISQVAVAASKDEALPILTTILLEVTGNIMTLYSTDRYRLATRELEWEPNDKDISRNVLIKSRTLSDISKSLNDSGKLHIGLSADSELIGFESNSRNTTSLLVDGEYPKVNQLFPEVTPTHAIVKTANLSEAVNRVSLVAERNSPIFMNFTDAGLSLNAGNDENSQASENIESTLAGEEITVAFNPSYLVEGLNALHADYAKFSFTSPEKPAVLTGQEEIISDKKPVFRYLLMPIRQPN